VLPPFVMFGELHRSHVTRPFRVPGSAGKAERLAQVDLPDSHIEWPARVLVASGSC
jgi:hypothetical protein